MNDDNSVAYVVYKIYNQFGIRGAPAFVLDLFVPFLVENGKYFLVGKMWKVTTEEAEARVIMKEIDKIFSEIRKLAISMAHNP